MTVCEDTETKTVSNSKTIDSLYLARCVESQFPCASRLTADIDCVYVLYHAAHPSPSSRRFQQLLLITADFTLPVDIFHKQ